MNISNPYENYMKGLTEYQTQTLNCRFINMIRMKAELIDEIAAGQTMIGEYHKSMDTHTETRTIVDLIDRALHATFLELLHRPRYRERGIETIGDLVAVMSERWTKERGRNLPPK